MRRKLLFAVLVFSASQIIQTAALAQSGCNKKSEFVVREVKLEDESHLSPKQVADFKSKLIGRCFSQSELSQTATQIFDALKQQGYTRAWVQEPILRVLDSKQQPKPVSLVFDLKPGSRKVSAIRDRDLK
jgi:outer membrane protein assembly factor BamA